MGSGLWVKVGREGRVSKGGVEAQWGACGVCVSQGMRIDRMGVRGSSVSESLRGEVCAW